LRGDDSPSSPRSTDWHLGAVGGGLPHCNREQPVVAVRHPELAAQTVGRFRRARRLTIFQAYLELSRRTPGFSGENQTFEDDHRLLRITPDLPGVSPTFRANARFSRRIPYFSGSAAALGRL